MTKLAIFDCDGTLVDSGASIHAALGTALSEHGHECPPQHVTQQVIGLSLEDAMAALVPQADHYQLSRSYKDAFVAMRGSGQVKEPLYDGIAELLDALAADGWLLGVATGKSDRGLRHCLTSHGILERFATLQTADRHPSKPHPAMALAAVAAVGAEPDRTVFIGDTGWDMGCARAARCGAIGVNWGYHDDAELWRMGAHHIATAPSQVARLAQQWIGSQP